jgi:hypothetical protein
MDFRCPFLRHQHSIGGQESEVILTPAPQRPQISDVTRANCRGHTFSRLCSPTFPSVSVSFIQWIADSDCTSEEYHPDTLNVELQLQSGLPGWIRHWRRCLRDSHTWTIQSIPTALRRVSHSSHGDLSAHARVNETSGPNLPIVPS